MTEYKKIFFDTAPIIYFLDEDINYAEKVRRILSDFLDNEKQMVTSTITCTEYKDFKTMDSLQLAAACVQGCDLFLTNDKQLRQFREIKCVTVDLKKKPVKSVFTGFFFVTALRVFFFGRMVQARLPIDFIYALVHGTVHYVRIDIQRGAYV